MAKLFNNKADKLKDGEDNKPENKTENKTEDLSAPVKVEINGKIVTVPAFVAINLKQNQKTK